MCMCGHRCCPAVSRFPSLVFVSLSLLASGSAWSRPGLVYGVGECSLLIVTVINFTIARPGKVNSIFFDRTSAVHKGTFLLPTFWFRLGPSLDCLSILNTPWEYILPDFCLVLIYAQIFVSLCLPLIHVSVFYSILSLYLLLAPHSFSPTAAVVSPSFPLGLHC